jgi:DNA-binding transcriptional ArsR family regulator
VAAKRVFKQIIDPILAKALTHPLRGEILLTLGERGIASPKEIAAVLELDLTEISYHVRKLNARGLIKLVRTERRRGVREHFYELTKPLVQFDEQEWKRLPVELQDRFSDSLLRTTLSDAVDAMRAGTFNADDCHQSRVTMPVDQQGRREAVEVMKDALERLIEIEKACAKRMALPSDDAVPLAVYMVAFETATGAERRESEPLSA